MNPLIEPAELADLLASEPGLVLADVRFTLGGPPGLGDFQREHLPGAQWVDLEQELSGPPATDGGRHPLPAAADFEAAMRRLGISADTLVVAYDAASSLAASRLWWLLTDAGHDHVRVLNGGLAAWSREGRPIVSGLADAPEPGTFEGRPGQRSRLDADGIAQRMRQTVGPELVDVRAAERYRGDSEPIDPVAGHIPGAINRPSMDHVDDTGRFLPRAELEAHFADLVEPVFYCGSGITAAHSLLALTAAGRTGAIYPGSWSDWISDPTRPVATGTKP